MTWYPNLVAYAGDGSARAAMLTDAGRDYLRSHPAIQPLPMPAQISEVSARCWHITDEGRAYLRAREAVNR